MFQPSLLCGDSERNSSLNCVRINGRAIIGALRAIERTNDALDIAHLSHNDLGPERLQRCAAAIFPVHHGTNGIARLK